jgi:hypothetical protein
MSSAASSLASFYGLICFPHSLTGWEHSLNKSDVQEKLSGFASMGPRSKK